MSEHCDLCDGKAEYLLCQQHLDMMRFPDVFSTEDGEYPEHGAQVLWCDNSGDTFIGGYDKSIGWFGPDDYGDDDQPIGPVLWCKLPGLLEIYQQENALRGKKAQP